MQPPVSTKFPIFFVSLTASPESLSVLSKFNPSLLVLLSFVLPYSCFRSSSSLQSFVLPASVCVSILHLLRAAFNLFHSFLYFFQSLSVSLIIWANFLKEFSKGKTTYCNGMSQFLQLIGRKVAVINLDPANDSLPYECAVNIEDLIKLSDVMMEHSLGPNGGLVYCMDYLEKNIDWLQARLAPLLKDHYFLFDFPGQVELFSLHSNAKSVIMKLIKNLNLRLTAVHLVDAHLCSDPGKYVSALLLSLSTMLHLELPHVNVLSKIDLIENYGRLAFNLDFYTDVQDLSYLQHHLDQDPRSAKYRKLTKELCGVIEDFGLVNFTTLDIQDKESVGNLVKLLDKTNGYIFAGMEASAVEFSKIAVVTSTFTCIDCAKLPNGGRWTAAMSSVLSLMLCTANVLLNHSGWIVM
ncbi:unnamed protein product [Citrullus colocynthis]|uniref:GPN-loop GTPase 2 n=1 Tax=Citrullus colocynthis TaxID=252529 RepID=A0ABP0YDM1_9ROSI